MYLENNTTIINTIIDLQSRGFYSDFCMVNEKLFCVQQKCFFDEDEFSILELHCFPCDDKLWRETVVYGIECINYFMKGILLNSFRGNATAIPPVIIKKVSKFWARK